MSLFDDWLILESYWDLTSRPMMKTTLTTCGRWTLRSRHMVRRLRWEEGLVETVTQYAWKYFHHEISVKLDRQSTNTERIRIQCQGIVGLISGQDYYEFGVNETWQSGFVCLRVWSKSASQIKTSDTNQANYSLTLNSDSPCMWSKWEN